MLSVPDFDGVIAMYAVDGSGGTPLSVQAVTASSTGVVHFTAPTNVSAVVFQLLGSRGQVLASSGVTIIVVSAPACAVPGESREVAPEMYQAVTTPGERYYEATFDCFWVAGPVVLAADAAGQDPFASDDAVSLEITRPDGTSAYWSFDFSNLCTTITDSQPLDVSAYFQPGINRVIVRLNDDCGSVEGNPALYFSTSASGDAPVEAATRQPSTVG
jgi:hypothetical protein